MDLDIKRVLAAKPAKHVEQHLAPLMSDEGKAVNPECVLPTHPTPLFKRESWQNLNGWWEYAIVSRPETMRGWDEGQAIVEDAEAPEEFSGRILVPFSPETALSGVNRMLLPEELLWYRRTVTIGALEEGKRQLLHFEAVDYACSCRINGERVGSHASGYLPFVIDITEQLKVGENTIELCVYDPSETGEQPRGKQRIDRGDIWYTAQSGIYQTVWLETVPAAYVQELLIDANPDESSLAIAARVSQPGGQFSVVLVDAEGNEVASGIRTAEDETVALVVPVESPRLWNTEDPYLYDLIIEYEDDRVDSYCAFRTTTIETDEDGKPRFCLNHEPIFLRGILDQGYWPESLLTPPTEEALRADIRIIKEFGFNMARKHIKVEAGQWYRMCDEMGLLVWQDMICGGGKLKTWYSGYKPTLFRSSWGRYRDDSPSHWKNMAADGIAYQKEWLRTTDGVIKRLRNHPCIVTWVLFNESFGQFNAADATQRVKALDPTRPIDAVSGWYDQQCGSYLSVHNYFRSLRVYPDRAVPPRAFVISEFGGITFNVPGHRSLDSDYGYDSFVNADEWRAAVKYVIDCADAQEANGLVGYVFTQLSDVEEETNGLVTYDRVVNKMEYDENKANDEFDNVAEEETANKE